MLFDPFHDEVPDEELAALLPELIAQAGRLPRSTDVYLAGLCAEHLVEGLRDAGLHVIRAAGRLHP